MRRSGSRPHLARFFYLKNATIKFTIIREGETIVRHSTRFSFLRGYFVAFLLTYKKFKVLNVRLETDKVLLKIISCIPDKVFRDFQILSYISLSDPWDR